MEEFKISIDEFSDSNSTVLCIIEGGQQTFLHHGRGEYSLIAPCLVWGPDEATTALRELKRLDSVPSNSPSDGMAIDVDRRRLILMENYMNSMPPHVFTLLNRLIAVSWEGYELISAVNYSDFLALTRLEQQDSVSIDRRISTASKNRANKYDFSSETLDIWIAVLVEPNKFVHYVESDIDARFANEGIKVIESCDSYDEPPDEIDICRGALIDPMEGAFYSWGFELSTSALDRIKEDAKHWRYERIPTDGYRWQLLETCNSDITRAECLATDAELLSQFFGDKIRNPKFAIANFGNAITVFSNKIFYSGFGCLALAIFIPSLLIMAVTGYWQSGMIIYAVVIGFLFLIATLKFRDIKSRFGNISSSLQQDLLQAWPGPETPDVFDQQLDSLLEQSGLPSLADIEQVR